MLKIRLAGLALSGFLLWGCSDAVTLIAENESLQDELENSPILTLRDIELRHGEQGIELWRLKAEKAGMRRGDRKIIVQKPSVIYFSPPNDADAFFISSVSGDIDQTNQMLSFLEDVLVTRQNTQVRGDLLIYNGTAKTMTLPQGGAFSNGSMNGKALLVCWRMTERLLVAEGDVQVVFSAGLTKNKTGGEAESPPVGAR
ncbi:MAG: LPS export ABC transporter periplasmic protein LptC [Deltaproteobacteria bacterium]|jgi:hypothetical protein|nr:LPS export ABC transporter periplasmic protein LptC [Deltaproteobacteria bacterium]